MSVGKRGLGKLTRQSQMERHMPRIHAENDTYRYTVGVDTNGEN